MRLKLQTGVLRLVVEATGGRIESSTPDWLIRPGENECGESWPLIRQIYRDLTDAELPVVMRRAEWRRVDGVLILPNGERRIVEVDESQHFNCYRAETLRRYPAKMRLGFDRNQWTEKSQHEPKQKSGGWAKPKPPLFPGEGGRHRQRAFRDALADILPPLHGFRPTIRIAHFEVEQWIWSAEAAKRMGELLTSKFEAEQFLGVESRLSEPQLDRTGSTFDSFLEEEGMLEDVQALAVKRVIAWQLAEAMRVGGISKKAMAERMGTSRSQLDRLLDPENSAVHLQTMARAARAVGKRLRVEMIDAA